MGLSDEQDRDFPKLHANCSNWRVWLEHANDRILGCNHWRADDMIKALKWDGQGNDPAAVFLNLPVSNNDEKAFKVAHQQTFRFLRGKLEEALYNKTMQLQHKTVPHLIRFLRNEWNDGSVIDRDRLRNEMDGLTIDKFTNYSEYETTFTNLCAAMEANGINEYASEESKLYRLIKGLNETWKLQIEVVQAGELPYAKASAYFQNVAKQNHSITGTMVIASTKSKRSSERVHFTDTPKQACIQHAKTGQCRFGDNCKFSHGNTNTQGGNNSGGATDGRPNRGPGSGTNTHCSKCKQKLDNAPTSHKFCKPCYKETQKAQREAKKAKGKAVLTVQERQLQQDQDILTPTRSLKTSPSTATAT